MIARNGLRSISHASVPEGAQRREAGNTTGGWQDKRPRGAASVGCVVSIGYEANSRGAGFPRTSQLRRFLINLSGLVRGRGSRP